MAQWSLSAASGRDVLSGDFRRQTLSKSGSIVLWTEITLKGMFWPLLDIAAATDLMLDYSVLLPQIICTWKTVGELIVEMDEWLEHPKKISIDLCAGIEGQSLLISFGPSDRLISSMQTSTCSIVYAGTVFRRGEWSFVVDQSFIRIFRDELRRSLDFMSSMGGAVIPRE